MLPGTLHVSPTTKSKGLRVFGAERCPVTGRVRTGSTARASPAAALARPGAAALALFCGRCHRPPVTPEVGQRVALGGDGAWVPLAAYPMVQGRCQLLKTSQVWRSRGLVCCEKSLSSKGVPWERVRCSKLDFRPRAVNILLGVWVL